MPGAQPTRAKYRHADSSILAGGVLKKACGTILEDTSSAFRTDQLLLADSCRQVDLAATNKISTTATIGVGNVHHKRSHRKMAEFDQSGNLGPGFFFYEVPGSCYFPREKKKEKIAGESWREWSFRLRKIR